MKIEKVISRLKAILKAPTGYFNEGKTTENLVQDYIDELELKHTSNN